MASGRDSGSRRHDAIVVGAGQTITVNSTIVCQSNYTGTSWYDWFIIWDQNSTNIPAGLDL